MTRLKRTLIASTALLLSATVAIAGTVRDFEGTMRAAYADYRDALFLTNANKPTEAAASIAKFKEEWGALAADNAAPPPQYADDPGYAETLRKVAKIAELAATQAASGKLTEAHGTLEEIRDQIGQLHERNGLIAFSDRMNAYHAAMERVLEKNNADVSPAALTQLLEDTAILFYLATDLVAHPPTEAGSDETFKTAVLAVIASVQAVQNAARAGDAAAAKQAVGGLKVPYSKLFLRFG